MKTRQDYIEYIKEELNKYDKPITKSILKLVEEHKDMDNFTPISKALYTLLKLENIRIYTYREFNRIL